MALRILQQLMDKVLIMEHNIDPLFSIKMMKKSIVKRLHLIQYLLMVAVITAFMPEFGPQPVFAARQTTPIPEEDIQVLTSGPIHEAFAEIVALDPEPGVAR